MHSSESLYLGGGEGRDMYNCSGCGLISGGLCFVNSNGGYGIRQ